MVNTHCMHESFSATAAAAVLWPMPAMCDAQHPQRHRLLLRRPLHLVRRGAIRLVDSIEHGEVVALALRDAAYLAHQSLIPLAGPGEDPKTRVVHARPGLAQP